MNHYFTLTALLLVLFSFSSCSTRSDQDILPSAKMAERFELGVRVKTVPASGCCKKKGESKIDNLLLITKVKTGKIAESMGLMQGDLIYTINGQIVSGMADSYAVMRSINDSEMVTVELFRDNELLEFTN